MLYKCEDDDMPKTVQITARVDPKLKKDTEKVFDELGLSTSQAITLFFKQVNLRKGLPFAVSIPNVETHQSIDEALTGKNLHEAKSVDELFDEP
jgi:DNA-damage-inducible protein J